jgi:hypothetical protein
VLTDLQKFTSAQMESADTLFQSLAEAMIDQLDLDISLESIWSANRGWNVNFERFLRREALAHIEGHLVWGLDEVDRLFEHPYSADVFGLFRSWHNERSLNPTGPWGRLTLAIAYATEVHLFISNLNQSPFNVGTRLTLEDFTRDEVSEMNGRYGAPLPDEPAVARYFALVGGNPYLVRRGMNAMVTQGQDVHAFEALADRDDGIFGDHLRRLVGSLGQDEVLLDAVCGLLRGGDAGLSAESFYRLRSAGVVVGDSAEEARFRCRLYQRYLERRLL